MQQKYADERIDINPKFWLRKYRQTSITYLLKMLLFYHGIGFVLTLAGTYLADQLVPDYEAPKISRSLIPVLTAGPIEETIFFGIPFYLLGNPYFVLVTGSIWATLHILNTGTLAVSNLAFGNLLFVIPSLFFSLRTWVSGKGWFAVVTHSAWNGIFFAAGCAYGEFPCTIFGAQEDLLILITNNIVFSAALLGLTYLLHKRKKPTSFRS